MDSLDFLDIIVSVGKTRIDNLYLQNVNDEISPSQHLSCGVHKHVV